MAYTRADWSVLRGALGVFASCALLSAIMLGATHFFAEDMASEFRAHHGKFRDASRKYLSVDQDERAIAEHYPHFVDLYRRGVIGDEHRLSWVEALRGAAADLALPALSYDVEAQQPYQPDYPLATGAFDVRVSRMHLSAGLLHEGDLESLLEELARRAEGLYSVRACDLRRSAGEARPGARLVADCLLEWYTLELRGSHIDLAAEEGGP
ncbi:MAG TPA: hypothetical protein PJ986_01200 [Gammaproteobacteria bacterium]|nr:hypothetical protein [Gammaproteobacteria bacterium]